MNAGRIAILSMVLLASAVLGLQRLAAAEPSVGSNGWTNIPGVLEGILAVRPVTTTLPKPALGYVEYLPKGYNAADTATRWPVVFVLLHTTQAGDGTDTAANGFQLRTKLTSAGPLANVASLGWDFPCIIISPQTGSNWGNTTTIKAMVDYVKTNYRVDSARLYMTGMVEGASGTLRFATAFPGVLAGIVPIEPTYGPTTAAEATAVAHLPMWIAQAFADQVLNRRNAITWMNQATLSDTGVTSDLMAAYPGYGATINHYVCDADASGLPLAPNGPSALVTGATLTTGSAAVALPAGNAIANAGSFFVSLWSGSDAAPFTRVTFGSDPTSYVVKSVNATTITLTHPYTGASQTADAHIITPNGTVVSAWYQANGSWAWPRTSAQTPPPAGASDSRLFTMFWQNDFTAAATATWQNGQVWDWLLSRGAQATPPTPATVALSNLAATYTGAAQGATVTTTPAGLAVGVTYGGAAALPVNAGAYAVAATITDPLYTGSASGTFTIAPANVGIALAGLNAVWDGAPKAATVTTMPAGVPVTLAYAGGTAPVEPGTYTVSASSSSANYTGTAIGSLTIAKATATVALGGLSAVADGSPKPVTTTTNPPGLAVTVTYDGAGSAPSAAGSYAVAATIADAHYQGSANGTLTITSGPAAGVTVAEHADHQVVQRVIGGTSAPVAFSGTITGAAPARLDARVVAIVGGGVAVDWTTIASAPVPAAWNASLNVPQGGWYRIEVRSVNAGGNRLATAASVLPWGVGINILCIGQSNMVGFGDTNFTLADDRVALLRGGATWGHLVDPWVNGGKASCGPALGNTLVAALGIPIGLVPAATLDTTMVGTRPTDLSFRNPANHADATTIYGKALRAATAAGGVEFVCISQGAAEAFLNTVTTTTYTSAFNLMKADFISDLPHGSQVKFVLSQLGRRVSGSADAGYNAIREAHRMLDDGSTTLLAGSTMDFTIIDTISHYGQAGQDPHGRRFARAILASLGRRGAYGGPRVTSARFSDATRTIVQVGIAHRGGSDFTPVTGFSGFVVRDAVGQKSVTAARLSGSIIALTCTTPCSGATTITYLAGMNPAGPLGLFKDNQGDPEPLLPITVPLVVQEPPAGPAAFTPRSLPAIATANSANPVSAAVPTSVSIAEHGDHQVIQRVIGTTSSVVAFSGTIAGPQPDHVEARIVAGAAGPVVVDWTTIASTPSATAWAGTLTIPQGGWYAIEARSIDASGAILASASSSVPWGVGIDILCIGQSNMVGHGDLNFTVAADRVGLLRAGTSWQHLVDPWITGGMASCGPELGNTLVADLGIPIGLVPAATLDTTMVGTRPTDLSFRNPANHADATTIYGKALRAATAAGGVEFVCISQGAAEAFLNTVTTADYVSAFTLMENHFVSDLPHGSQVTFVLSQLGRRVSGSADAGYDAIREAHRQLDDGTSTLLAGSTMDFPIVDAISHYGQAGQDPHGRRFARAILAHLGRRAVYGGPRIAEARFRDDARTVIQVGVSHRGGSDFQPVTSIPGFIVRDSGGLKAVTAARVSGSIIALTCATACSGATSITYLEGMNPTGPLGLFRDNQADPEPLLPVVVPLTVQDPLIEPTITAQPEDAVVVAGGSATFTLTATGSAPLHYQWQRDGLPIPGATGATVVLGTTLNDAGARFACVVTNAVGTAQSAGALLTVTPQTLALAIAPSGTTSTANLITFHFTFGAPVTGFSAAAITLTNGSAGPLSSSAAHDQYTLAVTAAAPGPVTVSVAAGVVSTALARNQAAAATVVFAPVVTPAPQVAISSPATLVAGAPATLTFTWSVPVTGFAADDVTIGGLATAALVDGGDQRLFTTTITPPMPGTLTVTVAAHAATASDGQTNPVAVTASLSVQPAAAPPVITAQPQSASVVAGQSVSFSITATGTAPLTYQWQRDGISITGATTTSITMSTTLSDSGAHLACLVGNGAGATLSSAALLTVTPQALAVSIAPNGTTVAAGPIDFDITFGVPVTGFTAANITISNGTAGSFNASPAGDHYTLQVVPVAAGAVTVSVPAGAVTTTLARSAGATATVTFLPVVGPAPTLVISSPSDLVAGTSGTILFTWSEPVTGFVADDITIGGVTPGTVLDSGDERHFSVLVTPTSTGPLIVVVSAHAAQAADMQTNAGAVSTTFPVLASATPPAGGGNVPSAPASGGGSGGSGCGLGSAVAVALASLLALLVRVRLNSDKRL